ncbi:C-C motif chemokine 27a [Labrus bergylta]|uniref:Chemokine interleukin-8-like domain-containing protein n=1 Tax=Labrus bergylta TaxID=56723 RepID=A0A3Q3G0Q3_9LABR
MDVKVFFVAVCLLAFVITAIDAAGIPKCCINTQKEISASMLRRVRKWKVQKHNSACDIDALILHVKNRRKPICVDISLRKFLLKLAGRS